MRIIGIYAILICTQFSSNAVAENRMSAYFSNDSVNGLMISDAYETHNMGLIIASEDYFVSLDLVLYRQICTSTKMNIGLQIGPFGN